MIENETGRVADVICQHKRDGTIIPLKIRIQDEDGEFQTFQVKAYKDMSCYGKYIMPSGDSSVQHLWKFECKIQVFKRIQQVELFYNAIENRWRVRERR